MSYGDHALRAVLRGLKFDGIKTLETASDQLPDLLVSDARYGLIALDINTSSAAASLSEQEKKAHKASKLRALRIELGDLSRDVKVQYLSVRVPDISQEELKQSSEIIRRINLENMALNEAASPLLLRAIEIANQRFNPSFIFVGKPRVPVFEDPFKYKQREEVRFSLDSAQARIAEATDSGVTVLTGPAGSGKTLVLIARARILAKLHPNWVIRLICFNNALKPYLSSLVEGLKNVEAMTFYELITANGHSFRMKGASEAIAEKQYLSQIHISKNIDALLVDETQDFFPGWVKYMAATVRENRGGTLLAGDESQALYRNSKLGSDLEGLEPQVVRLEQPYRSTRQILEFVEALFPEAAVDNSDLAPDGELPELIYVQGGLSHHSQALALVLDIARNLESDSSLKLRDIGILCTRHFEIKALAGDLRAYLDQKYGRKDMVTPIFQGFASDLDMQHDSLKLLTVHSAKGLEFRHVYLVGLEVLAGGFRDLPANYQSIDELREANLNLIGPTRAKDRLTVYYSKDNLFLKRLSSNEALFQVRRYPDDYEVPEEWLN